MNHGDLHGSYTTSGSYRIPMVLTADDPEKVVSSRKAHSSSSFFAEKITPRLERRTGIIPAGTDGFAYKCPNSQKLSFDVRIKPNSKCLEQCLIEPAGSIELG